VTLTLKIFSIFFFKFFLLAPSGTLKVILFNSDKFVYFSVTTGKRILSYKWILSILRIPFLQFFYWTFSKNYFLKFYNIVCAKMIYVSNFYVWNISYRFLYLIFWIFIKNN
jgi:hypothetical protein